MNGKDCRTCKKKYTCIKRSTTLFMLFIATHRYKEAEEAKENMNVAGDCENYVQAADVITHGEDKKGGGNNA